MYFGIVGVFCIISCYFEYRTRILCIWLYMETWFKCIFEHFFKTFPNKSQKCEQFSYGPFVLRCSGIWGPKWSPYVAEASLGRVIVVLVIAGARSIFWPCLKFWYIYIHISGESETKWLHKLRIQASVFVKLLFWALAPRKR